ncbi:MAG TPA: Rieske 2Fe-2S domain-containing protein [Puia sp.]|jgi:menaquinol-cytochrome c reductase iron-sulfur subunit
MSEKPKESKMDRKEFMIKISLGIAAAGAATVAIPVVSALILPVLNDSPGAWRKVGLLKDFPLKSMQLISFTNADPVSYSGKTAQSAAWLHRKSADEFIAFAANCTHLGCPVRWEEGAQLFMCPCHGGVYYIDGTVAAGPPPKPLTRYKVRVSNDIVQIQTAPLPITGP